MNLVFGTAYRVSFRAQRRTGGIVLADSLIIGKTGNDTIYKQLTFTNSYKNSLSLFSAMRCEQ